MTWKPITADELRRLVDRDLSACSPDLRLVFEATTIPPEKWRQSPWGDKGGGFWAIAVHGDRVLWYNDIEDGFNVSHFSQWREIPGKEYWCNQDDPGLALRQLAGEAGYKLGPPQPMDES